MSLNRGKNGKNESDESLNDEEEDKNQSVLAPPPMKGRKGSLVMTFAMKKAAKTPKFRHKNKILTKKQVDKLNSMKPYEIAKNHNFKELEYIVDSLTKLYAQLYKYREEIRKAKEEDAAVTKVSAVSSNSKKEKKRKSRKRFTLGRRSGKRKQSVVTPRRGSVMSKLKASTPATANGLKPSRGKRSNVRRSSVSRVAQNIRNRTSAVRSSVPNFAKLAARIKNITSNPEDDLPVEKLKEYSSFAVENALEKSDKALKAHQRFKEKEKKRWKEWEEKEDKTNTDCLIEMSGLIPSDLRFLKEDQIERKLHGNKYLARRFSRHKVFLLFNMTYDQLQSIHPADLKNRYHISGLDVFELRALYAHTCDLKRPWKYKLREKLHSQLEKQARNELSENEIRHPAYSNKPDFESENRKPSVVKFIQKRELPDKRAPSLVAMELNQLNNIAPKQRPEVKRTKPKKIKISKKAKEEEEAVKSIYLVKRGPDAPVDTNSLTASSRKNNSITRKPEDTSDGDVKKRRPKDNIFSAFEDVKNSGVNDSRRKNRPLAVGEKRLTDFDDSKVEDPKLESYFASREAEEEEDEVRDHDFDEEEYKVKPGDQEQDLKRKQSELFIKAFEMINSDDVDDNDEVFLKTLRSLSVFTASMSGDELDEELEKYAGDESEPESHHATPVTDFYLTAPPNNRKSKRSEEDEMLTDVL